MPDAYRMMRAYQEAARHLKTNHPAPLPPAVGEEMGRLLASIRALSPVTQADAARRHREEQARARAEADQLDAQLEERLDPATGELEASAEQG